MPDGDGQIRLTPENSIGLVCNQCVGMGQKTDHLAASILVHEGFLVFVCTLHQSVCGQFELTATALLQARQMKAQQEAQKPKIEIARIIPPSDLRGGPGR